MSGNSSAVYPAASHKGRLVVAAVLLIGFALRIYRIDAQAYSGDEAFSIINWTRVPLDYLFDTIALIDPQPPAALLGLSAWVHLVGDSELPARMLSAFASTITLAAAYAIARTVAGKRLGLIALLITAVSPFHIWYAQDFRSYSLWMSLSALSALWMLHCLKDPRQRRLWIGYVLIAALSIYTFYLEAFFLIGQNVYVLFQSRKHTGTLRPWIIAQTAIAALLAPWFLRPALRQSGYLPTAGPPDLPSAFQALIFGEALPEALQIPLAAAGTHTFSAATIAALALVAAGLAVAVLSAKQHLFEFSSVLGLLPIGLLALLAAVSGLGYFRPRYVAAASVPLILATAALIEELIPDKRPRRAVPAVAAATALTIVAVIAAIGLWTYHTGPPKAPPWRQIARVLFEQVSERDVVIRNYPDPAFDYYYAGRARAVLLPVQANADPADTQQELEDLLAQYEYVWFLPVPSATYDQEEVVALWLYDHAELISEQWIGATHLLQFASYEPEAQQIDHAMDIPFAEAATLRGYRVTPPFGTWEVGTTLYFELFWEPLARTEQQLTVFFHLLGPPGPDGSPLWGQDDHPPQQGRTSTQAWEPGALLRDIYVLPLPPDLPDGEYAIAVGLYDPVTLERLPLDSAIPQSEPQGATLIAFSRSDLN
jgi:4-amino-4-deoxy-L-arabinose transferase-like glycosyltransferase